MLLCPWEGAKYIFFSSNVPSLFYYSHGISIAFAMIFGLLLILRARKALSAKILFIITSLFSIWVLLDLYLWATNDPASVMFFWSIIILVEVSLYVFSIYFIDVFNEKKDVSFKKKLLMFLVIIPVIITLPTSLNLIGVDISYCNAEEGFIAKYYTYVVEIFSVLWIFFYSIRTYKRNNSLEVKRQIFLSTVGILFFLLALSSGNLIGSFTEQWGYSQFGLFIMPIFITILAYLVVKYNSFNVKLIATEALVWGLAILIGSQFLFIKVTLNYLLTGVTFFATIVFGQMLIKSVKKEIQQKEELAVLNVDLQKLIQQRESLMHLINHKVKGSFTHSKYIFAGLLDGMFGEITPEIKKMAQMGLDSDTMGVRTIDLILNAANLQSGSIKYEMKPVSLKELVQKTLEEKKEIIEKKGLKLETNIGAESYSVNGDIFWLKEVVNNLLDNALNYTKEGKIIVVLEKKENKIIFSVKDTGIGISPEDKKKLFTEGGRGSESVKTNVDSTGYGLYSVKLIVEAHKGRVWALSEGPGKGSEFIVEFDAE